MFIRTDSGISNRSLFTGSDYTLYVEGGGGVANAGSSDVIFWGDLLKERRKDLKVAVVAFGGKPELEAIADKILSGEISNTLVALDADFDEMLEERRESNFILYTYGYSWENDAFCIDLLDTLLFRTLKIDNVQLAAAEPARQRLKTHLSDLVPWINADFWLRSMNSSLFPRIAPGRVVGTSAITSEATINRREIWKIFKSTLKEIPLEQRKPRPGVWILSAASLLHGHLYKHLIRATLVDALRLLGRKTQLSDDLMEHITFPAFCRLVAESNHPRCQHYRSILEKIPA